MPPSLTWLVRDHTGRDHRRALPLERVHHAWTGLLENTPDAQLERLMLGSWAVEDHAPREQGWVMVDLAQGTILNASQQPLLHHVPYVTTAQDVAGWHATINAFEVHGKVGAFAINVRRRQPASALAPNEDPFTGERREAHDPVSEDWSDLRSLLSMHWPTSTVTTDDRYSAWNPVATITVPVGAEGLDVWRPWLNQAALGQGFEPHVLSATSESQERSGFHAVGASVMLDLSPLNPMVTMMGDDPETWRRHWRARLKNLDVTFETQDDQAWDRQDEADRLVF